jgi:shikimate dehydrogenase
MYSANTVNVRNSLVSTADTEGFFCLGLVGYPLSKSLSPIIHQTLLTVCGLQGFYQLIEIEPTVFAQQAGFSGVMALHPNLKGFNITIPYKLDAYQWATTLTPQAQRIQAVNTIKRVSATAFIGHNTDGQGFYQALPSAVTATLNTRHAVILGAGGACRAVLESLLFASPAISNITLVVRSLQNAQALVLIATQWAAENNVTFNVITFEALTPPLLNTVGLLVNTTPVGMYPAVEASPLTAQQVACLPPDCFVSDLIYKPAQTQLLAFSQQAGLAHQNGLDMLIHQAMAAFSFWTNLPIQPIWYTQVHAAVTGATVG